MYHLSALSPVKDIIFAKSAQTGGTEAGINWIGYLIDICPGPTLIIQPTIDMAKKFSKTRIQPMIDNCADLKKKIKPARSRDSGNTILDKQFPAGYLVIGGANSPNSLRSLPIQNVMFDEADSYQGDLNEEGSPIDLGEARQITFSSNRKTLKISTPTTEEGSAIWPAYLKSDQRKYFIPCIHCAAMQHLKFDQLRYQYNPQNETVTDVYYECEHCSGKIMEHHKRIFMPQGQWMQTAPENANQYKVGYHINSFYSPITWISWADIAVKYERAQNDVTKMRAFDNTILGLPSNSGGDAPPYEHLYHKRETYKIGSVPLKVGLITCGVDVQKDRVELEIVGWAKGLESYSIDYRVLSGTTSGRDSKVWKDLAAVLDETFKREDGTAMKISMMCVDSGYNTAEVYSFCNKFPRTRVIPTKGRDNQSIMISSPKATKVNQKGKKIGTTHVWSLGVSMIKSELFGWLGKEMNEDGTYPEGYCHFPQYQEEYFKGLASEKCFPVRNKKGYLVYEWRKTFTRNEPLDCRVYARAAAAFKGADNWNATRWETEAGKSVKTAAPKKTIVKRERKSSFWNGRD